MTVALDPSDARAVLHHAPPPPGWWRSELRVIMALVVPIIIAQFSRIGMTVIDTIMVGQHSTAALAHLGMGRSLTWVVIITGVSLLAGVSVFASRAVGAGQLGRCGDVLRQGLLFSLLLGAALTLLMLVTAGPVLLLFDLAPDMVDGGAVFAQVMALGFVPMMIGNCVFFWLQGIGRPRPATVSLTAALPLNILLNWLLIGGEWGLPALGATGAALATGVSFLLTTIAMLIYAARMPDAQAYGVQGGRWRGAWKHGGPLRRFGLAPGIASAIDLAAMNILGLWSGRFGEVPAGAFQVLLSVHMTVILIAMGFATAGSIRVGNAYGAQDWPALRRRGLLTAVAAFVIMAATAFAAFLVAPLVPVAFSDDAAVQTTSTSYLRVFAPFMALDGAAIVFLLALRAAGDQVVSSMLQVISFCGVVLASAALFVLVLGTGDIGLVLGFGCGVACALGFMGWRFEIVSRRLLRRAVL